MLRLMLLVSLTRIASSLFDEKLHHMYLTMPRAEFARYFNKQNYTWKMSEEPQYIRFMECVIADTEPYKTLPTKRHNIEAINNAPDSFDARTQWSQCQSISQIYNQGDCGSCWTFGSATTASDRTCIHKNVQVNLSEQDFECLQANICIKGGYNVDALNFWKNNGLVTQACKPYDINKLNQNTCTQTCVDSSIDYKSDKHFGSEVYAVDSDFENIKAELFQNGPIVAQIAAYEDLRVYHTGVYEHTFGAYISDHSVRVLGYGVENGVGYWLVANSWGLEWGDSGLFKTKQGQQDIHLESLLVTGKP